MKIISKERQRELYHDTKCGYVTVDCKVECHHCRNDATCDRCNDHRWLWGSSYSPGYGFRPYTLQSVCF